ncbi:16S rRNA (cytidine(1402)-2'-O)-methyltransferase [Pelomonas aquatica]|uniref:Ribosomal RNA small subunit methyltransferase I n=1 Tax=Pelomonas aquatica TaxID=431058 RepID=A0A9X4LI37_9BURK|nr:16S rRNA (cytidine(1402)-2'-O)-methyltransferase [Pelomonas aquatica]MCY4753525.1 16S rRNA (cytidine(1402)-2'-O)-methyltransferase [Pelomonas aquatica]MDG0863331.1 16S rRNA (cytidine(1402)-2'-O)-methyltransferase [Pelomonas aquatica]
MNNADSPLLRQAAQAAAGGQQYPAAALYVVATPIGNLADLSLRAIHVLGLVDAVACEDTRQSAVLLRHLGLHKPLIALHQHNEQEASGAVLARLAAGERVAYVSDAGTPAVSDPGAVLVSRAAAAGCRILPIPGASSAVTLLSVAGDAAAQGFAFAGFLPTKGGERRTRLQGLLAQAEQSQILFEAPHRIADLVSLLAELAPARRVTLGRELTKQFETVHTAPAAELPAWLAADAQRQRGEFALAIHAEAAARGDAALDDEALRVLKLLMAELPLKQAVALAAQISGAPRNALYDAGLLLKREC